MKNNVFSVIVSFNGEKWIRKCLDSLLESETKTQIIVIDNGSTDQTVQIIELEYSSIKLIKSKENLGFGKANNIGMIKALEANADFVFLLNQDAWIESTTLGHLIESLANHSDFGIMSPIHFNGDGTALDLRFSHYIAPEYCENLYSDLFRGSDQLKDAYEANFVNAAGWLINKATLEAVGGFNPLFFHYGEDYEYINRLKFHGQKIGVCPKSILFHDRKGAIEKQLSKGQQSIQKLGALLNINKPRRVDQEMKKAVRDILKNIALLRLRKTISSTKYWLELKKVIKIIVLSRNHTAVGGRCYLQEEDTKTNPISIYIP